MNSINNKNIIFIILLYITYLVPVASAGIENCTFCHGTVVWAPYVNLQALNSSMHGRLNNVNNLNYACYACHSDGTPPTLHTYVGNLSNVKNCEKNDCHSLIQSRYKEAMVYSHFQNANLNNNPDNRTNYNITTSVKCSTCHLNSLVTRDSGSALARVSHYGSKNDLIDSFNCTYCHLDKDNSETWANATLINENRTGLVEVEKERNTSTLFEGETLYLGEGYYLKLVEISTRREEAYIQLIKDGNVVDETTFSPDNPYKYETNIIIDNVTVKTPVVTLNITSIFKGDNNSFIQFEGFRITKIHTHKESKNSACYACHLYRYSTDKERYTVIDRAQEENSDRDAIYYTGVFADFNPGNKSKLYMNDEDYIFSRIDNLSGGTITYNPPQKYLGENESWSIADNYLLKLNDVSTDSKEAWLILTINNSVVEENVVKSGQEFNYTPGIKYKENGENNVTVFTAKTMSIFQGEPSFVILKDVVAISPGIMKTTSNTTLFGYNSSWLYPNDTLPIGRIPENLHSPNMFTDQGNWADCVNCHDTSKHLWITSINAISTGLGRHSILNIGASNKTALTDPIDKACWACHTNGGEPQAHSPTYIVPRNCSSCHTYREEPFYGARNVGDEPHGYEPNCESCHAIESHNVIGFDISAAITGASLSETRTIKGVKVKLSAKATAGYKMKLKAAEYFIDNTGTSGKGIPLTPSDEAFDSQNEELTAEINTTGIPDGEHIIYIHAMERNNRWGKFSQVNFTIENGKPTGIKKEIPGPGMVPVIFVLIIAYLAVSRRENK